MEEVEDGKMRRWAPAAGAPRRSERFKVEGVERGKMPPRGVLKVKNEIDKSTPRAQAPRFVIIRI